MTPRRLGAAVVLIAVLIAVVLWLNGPGTTAWTIMVYMNGDNDLEPFAMLDFEELAAVDYSDRVRVVVQFDRSEVYGPDGWHTTKRFLIRRGLKPTPEDAIYGPTDWEANMSDPNVLREFVLWTQQRYPATHYAVVIWSHGQGYRMPADAMVDRRTCDQGSIELPIGAPFRSVMYDGSHEKSEFYNAAIAQALDGLQVEVLAFDACLMGMVETLYAMQHVSRVMVASEELVPGCGYDYTPWLTAIVRSPDMDAEGVGRVAVERYAAAYGERLRTMTAARSGSSRALADAIDRFATELMTSLRTEPKQIIAARRALQEYGERSCGARSCFHHVDLDRFCQKVIAYSSREALDAAAEGVRTALKQAVILSKTGPATATIGDGGLAIYFPESGAAYGTDTFEQRGYRKGEVHAWPVAFVQERMWADFLHAYFAIAP